MKEEKFPHSRKPSYRRVCGEFWNLRGQQNWEGKKKKKKTQNTHLTTTPSREVAQMLSSTTRKQGLNREPGAPLLRVRTEPECPEDNLRELT